MSEQENESGFTTNKAKALASLIPGVPECVLEWIILNKVVNKKNAEQQDEGSTE